MGPPADLIMEDTIALSVLQLAQLTSANFPSPPAINYTSTNRIEVAVSTISKSAEYRELRTYQSVGEGSDY